MVVLARGEKPPHECEGGGANMRWGWARKHEERVPKVLRSEAGDVTNVARRTEHRPGLGPAGGRPAAAGPARPPSRAKGWPATRGMSVRPGRCIKKKKKDLTEKGYASAAQGSLNRVVREAAWGDPGKPGEHGHAKIKKHPLGTGRKKGWRGVGKGVNDRGRKGGKKEINSVCDGTPKPLERTPAVGLQVGGRMSKK